MAARRPLVRYRPTPRRQVGLSGAAVFAVVVVVGGAEARARGTADVALGYETDAALAECPSAAAFKDEIARQLGHDPFRENAPRRILVRFDAGRTGVEGHIEWRDAAGKLRGERRFWSRNESCAQLAHAIALVTAIQIQLLETADDAPATPAAPASPAPAAAAPPAPAPPAPPAPASAPATPRAEATAAVAPAPREPWIAVDAGVGVVQDLGDGPAMVVPHLALAVGRPASFGLRLAASGLGPGADVTRPEGVAHLDRFFMTLGVVRSFRVGRTIEPSLELGAGWQEVRVHGISAMPSLAQGHDTHAFSWVAAASGGLAFVLALRLAIAVEVEALLYRPSITVQVGSGRAARLDGAAVVVHGGLLARF
jgi:hypothetical protein